jgi:hypothetical protein
MSLAALAGAARPAPQQRPPYSLYSPPYSRHSIRRVRRTHGRTPAAGYIASYPRAEWLWVADLMERRLVGSNPRPSQG